MKIIGLDLSLLSTGVAIINRGKITLRTITTSPKTPTYERIERIIAFLIEYQCFNSMCQSAELVMIEKPFGILGNGKILVELLGIVKWYLFSDNQGTIPIMEISQTSLKKYATGYGNAQKIDMVNKAYEEFGIRGNNDEIDAFWLAQLGTDIKTGTCKYKYQREVIDVILAPKKKKKRKKKKNT